MKHLIKLLSLSLLATLIIIAAPAASAGFVSDFSGLEFREAAGFYTVIVDLSGTEYRFDGILDISDLEQQPEILSIASYHIYYEDTAVMDVTLREMESAESDPDITSSTGIVLTNGYYAVSFDINAEYEAFLTGLTLDNLQAVQLELINSVLTGTDFNMEHLDFIDTEKIEWGEGENKDLCWAASCSNILHYTGWAQKADLATPDDVFEVYIDAFSPAGGNAVYGIPWFFSGINEKQGEADWAQVDNTEEYAYGQFNGFLPEYAVDNFFTGYYMRTAPRDIEKAFAELRDGAGVSIAFGWYTPTWARNGGHAISLWGYIQKKDASGFDKNDYYALIVSDSDSDTGYDERRDAPNELWMLPLTSVVTAQGYDSWTMEGYNTNLYALLENFYALVPYSDECVREESVPDNRFDENAVDISAYIQILNSDNETDVFAAGDSVTLRFGCKNLSPLDWTEARTVTISYTLTDQHGEIVMNNSTEWTNTLNAGTILSARTTAKLPAGEYTFTVAVSLKDSAAAETYYSNNMLERHFTVLPEPELTLSALQNEDAFILSYEPADALQNFNMYELSVSYLQNDVWSDWLTVYVGRTLPESCAVSPTGTQIKFRLEAEVGGVLSHSWESEPLLLESDGTHVLADGGDLRALLQSDAVKDGDIILLQGTANVNDTNSDSAPWVIDKAVTIRGGTLNLRAGGILLSADVTLDGVNLMFANPVRNAILANGYTLTLKDVVSDSSTNEVHLFCGGLTGHSVTVAAGEHGQIIIMGTTSLGNMYAGSMSSDGGSNVFAMDATITVDKFATGKMGEVYACGALESYVDPDELLNPDYKVAAPVADAERFTAAGAVRINLYQNVINTVYATTGEWDNASVTFNGNGNYCTLYLENMGGLSVESGSLAFRGTALKNDISLAVTSGAQLDLTLIGDTPAVADFTGGGTLILGEEQLLTINGHVSGTTSVGIGEVFNGATCGKIDHVRVYIKSVYSAEDSFVLLTPQDDPDLKLVRDTNGKWTIPPVTYDVVIDSISAPKTVATESKIDMAEINYTVTFDSDLSFSYLNAVPVSIMVNGTYGKMAFDDETASYYYTFPEHTGLGRAEFFALDETTEVLYITANEEKGVIADGDYTITVIFPAENMKSGQKTTLTTVLSVGKVASGECGNDVTWKLSEDGTLTISGTGAMDSWQDQFDVPWWDKRNSILKVVVEEGVTTIGSYAFYGCSKLASVELPEGLTHIRTNVFYDCNELNEIVLPETLVYIGVYAFESSGLTKIVIPNSVTYMGAHVFDYCISLAEVTLSNGLTEISQYAFNDCWALTKVTVPESVKKLGICAFATCGKLTDVILPETLTEIGNNAFSGCRALKNITIPKNVKKIGSYAFSSCESLVSMEIPDGVTELSGAIFNGCTNLVSVKIPDSVTTIGNQAFAECSSLKELKLSDNVTSIGESAITACTSLTEFVIPKNVTELSYGVLYGCTNLKSIVIPNGVTLIGDRAFERCYKLESITIPASVTVIGDFAFQDCIVLEKVYYTGSVEQWAAIVIGEENDLLVSALLRTGVIEVSIEGNAYGFPVLTWGTIHGAEKYEIWRMNEDGVYELLDVTTATEYCDETAVPGVPCFYVVRAAKDKMVGTFSNIAVHLEMRRSPLGKIPG